MKNDKIKLIWRQTMLHFWQQIAVKTGYNIGYPSNIYIAITHHCNFRCQMCHDWMTNKGELSDREWELALGKLFEWLPGGAKINFSGGEPLVKKGFLDLLLRLKNKTRLLIGVTSNASLIDDENARKLMSLKLFNLNISLDSTNPEVHDHMRGKRGAFDSVLAAIENLSYWKMKIGVKTRIIIKTIISRENIGELDRLVYFVKDKGLNGIYFQPIEQTFGETPDTTWYLKSDLWPKDVEDVESTINGLRALKLGGLPILNSTTHLLSMIEYFRDPLKERKQICTLGYTTLFIYPDGKIYFCPSFNKIGNLVTDNLEELRQSERTDMIRDKIMHCKKKCTLTCQFQLSLWDKGKAFLTLIKDRSK